MRDITNYPKLEAGKTYELEMAIPDRMPDLELKTRLERQPPGMVATGGWRILALSTPSPHRRVIRGVWEGISGVLVPITAPAAVLGDRVEYVRMAVDDEAPLEGTWSLVPTREVFQGERYRFAVIPWRARPEFPNELPFTQILFERGWMVESVEPAPADLVAVMERISGLKTQTRDDLPPEDQVQAKLVTATWSKGPAALPNEGLYPTNAPEGSPQGTPVVKWWWYGPLEHWTAAGTVPGAIPGTADATSSSTAPLKIGAFVLGALALGGIAWAWQAARKGQLTMPHRARAANPVRYDSTESYRGVTIHVHHDDLLGTYCADYRALDRIFRGSGSIACHKSRETAIRDAHHQIDRTADKLRRLEVSQGAR